MTPDATGRWPMPARYDFQETTRLLRSGRGDPTVRRVPGGLWRTVRMPEGAATVLISTLPERQIEVQAWGEAAQASVAAVPTWLGLNEGRWTLPPHPVTDGLLARHAGLRLADTGDVFEGLMNIILQQRVSWSEAVFNWRRLVETLGETAPGPGELRLSPTPRAILAAGRDRLVDLGISRQQVMTLQAAAREARSLQRAATLPTDEAQALLQSIRGIGAWTSTMTLGLRLGRPEPLVSGDYSLPHVVSWAFAREERGSDARMAELLAPFPGQAFQVIRLLFAARITAPRFAPRRPVRFGRPR